jgi:hypothetical protein
MIKLQGKSQIITRDEVLTVQRKENLYYDDAGRPVAGDTVEFKVTCNVQPVAPDELLLQPEGDRAKEQFNLWIQNTTGKNKIRLNDIVVRNDRYYQTQEADDWGSYTKARIMAIDTGPDRNPWRS